jgi:integrase/recombinase XerD
VPEIGRKGYGMGHQLYSPPLFLLPRLSGTTIRRKLAALSSLFEHLCDANAVTHNPVKGVKRPKVESYEGKTPALGDGQARALLDAPATEIEKGKRDRAILSVLLYHGLRREESAASTGALGL